MGTRKHLFVYIGKDKYKLKEKTPITHKRYLDLKDHPQFSTFHFQRTGKMWRWYSKNQENYVTQKKQNQLLIKSYNEYLSKNEF